MCCRATSGVASRPESLRGQGADGSRHKGRTRHGQRLHRALRGAHDVTRMTRGCRRCDRRQGRRGGCCGNRADAGPGGLRCCLWGADQSAHRAQRSGSAAPGGALNTTSGIASIPPHAVLSTTNLPPHPSFSHLALRVRTRRTFSLHLSIRPREEELRKPDKESSQRCSASTCRFSNAALRPPRLVCEAILGHPASHGCVLTIATSSNLPPLQRSSLHSFFLLFCFFASAAAH